METICSLLQDQDQKVPNRRITAAELAKVQKRSKFGVRHDQQGKAERTYKGVLYHSKRECEYAQELDILQKAGKIVGWSRQVAYALNVPVETATARPDWRVKVADYVADFVVIGNPNRVIDVKGYMTPVSRLKIKMFEAQYGITVEIVR